MFPDSSEALFTWV